MPKNEAKCSKFILEFYLFPKREFLIVRLVWKIAASTIIILEDSKLITFYLREPPEISLFEEVKVVYPNKVG